MSNLNGKIAVVNGGNSGIGYASSKKLKSKGATVVITGRSPERVTKAADELGVMGIIADVKDLSALDKLVAIVSSEYGKVETEFH